MTIRRLLIAVLFACLALPARAAGEVAALPSFAEPGIAPDHAEIAFVSGGDIWTVPAAGGSARLLVAIGGAQSRPLYSPDGKKLAFTSSRTGNGDVYVLTLDGGELKRLTFDDGLDQVEAWSPDGAYVYFSSTAKNIAGSSDIDRVSVDGGTPMPVVDERYVHQYEAAPAPDGTRLAYVSGGFADQQWWRRGHAHIDETRIVVKSMTRAAYEPVTAGGAKELWPMWSPDGRALYYVSDRGGNDNLWTVVPGQKPRRLTSFSDDRVLWPSISKDGRTIVFERSFGIWSYDVGGGTAKPVEIVLRGSPARATTDHVTLTTRFTGLTLAGDGKKLAFTARGQIYAAASRDGGDAQRVTATHANESVPVWSPDSRRVAYVSDRTGGENLFVYDFASGAETQLTQGDQRNAYPVFAPDGRSLLYQRNGAELRLIDVASKADRLLARGEFNRFPGGSSTDAAFSPGGENVAFITTDARGFANVHVVRAAGGAAQPISFLANGGASDIVWSPDGTRLYYVTSQRTEDGQIAQIDLIPRAPKFREDQFRDLFTELPSSVPQPRPSPSAALESAVRATPRARRATAIDFAGIRDRLTFVPAGLNVTSIAISPDGKTLLAGAVTAGQQNLYTYSLDELATTPPVAKQLTATSGRKTNAQFTPDGTTVYYLENGRAFAAAADGKTPARAVPLTAEQDVDFNRDKTEMFAQAWTYLDDNYYDPKFHGTDWNAVHARYEPHVRGAQSPEELRRLLNLMVGELDSSHSGVGAPPPPNGPALQTGYLGVRYDPQAYARAGTLVIDEIVPLGPVDLTGTIKRGDAILAVNGQPVGPHVNVEELLANTIGKRTELSIAPHGDRAAARTVAVAPTDRPTEKVLLYRAWVQRNRATVEKASGGRLGYVHLYDMSAGALEQLAIDLDAQNQARAGVVVDVRNNNGGFIDPYAIDVFARRDYISFSSRGAAGRVSERKALGQRALGLPTVLLVNEHSLSDAENFTEGYRRTHLGRVVGVPTAGWIIFTGGSQLIDGSSVRLPTDGTFGADGVDMELHPRPVDVRVERRIGEADAGTDAQLDAAVRELTRETGNRR